MTNVDIAVRIHRLGWIIRVEEIPLKYGLVDMSAAGWPKYTITMVGTEASGSKLSQPLDCI